MGCRTARSLEVLHGSQGTVAAELGVVCAFASWSYSIQFWHSLKCSESGKTTGRRLQRGTRARTTSGPHVDDIWNIHSP